MDPAHSRSQAVPTGSNLAAQGCRHLVRHGDGPDGARRQPCPPTHYLAIGKPGDRRGYVTAIRAFALSGKLGDRLTMIGYGRHRRRLEHWARTLGIDAIVAFSSADLPPNLDVSLFDALILVSYQPERLSSLVRTAVELDLAVVFPDDRADMFAITSRTQTAYTAAPYDSLSYGLALSQISAA
jgi:glycosyltransferase involved in cell wall biosynthesis